VVVVGLTTVDPAAGAPLIVPGDGVITTVVGLLVITQDKVDWVCPERIGFGLAAKLVITGIPEVEPTVMVVVAVAIWPTPYPTEIVYVVVTDGVTVTVPVAVVLTPMP
jgi:hypothetical protein